MGRLIGFAAAAICVFAGIYLLQYNADTSGVGGGGTSWFQIIGHGMGIYFIGKGLFVARSTWLEWQQADRLAQLVEFAAYEHRESHEDETPDSSEPAPQSEPVAGW
jgi:hypothetical protein